MSAPAVGEPVEGCRGHSQPPGTTAAKSIVAEARARRTHDTLPGSTASENRWLWGCGSDAADEPVRS
jgi:hypothetical protein